MEGGRIIELSDPESMYSNPQQPFTKKLLAAAYLDLPKPAQHTNEEVAR
jgi:ABC-type dipeptide/oligopeptide/nickel transport system ATPase component